MKNILGRLYAPWFIFWFVVTMLLCLIPTAFCYYLIKNEKRRTQWIMNCYRAWMKLFMTLVFCRIKKVGRAFFKKGESYVVLCNHNSFFDILVSTPGVPGASKTLAKAELAKIPLFGFIYKAGSILVDRKDPKSRGRSMEEMKKALDQGLHLILFPEGTRNKTKEPLAPFYDGAFRIAIKNQKEIIPALLFNSKKVLPADKKFYAYPHKVSMHFLKPIPTKGLTLKDVKALKEKVFVRMRNYYVSNLNE